jgi:hypothetical protein
MKRNIYSYSKLWMILFVLMGAACTNQVEDAIPVSGQPIEFSVQSDWKEIPNTRSNPGKTQFEAGNKIQIFGFHKSLSGDEVKFMYRVGEPARGQIVTFDGTNWNYSPKRFWPKEGTLDFYASYPDYSVLYKEDKMTYEQPDFNPLGLDLLWGVSTGYNCANGRKDVEITMKHALAKVNISFSGFSDEIGSVIVTAYKTGWFPRTLDGGIPDWDVDDKTHIDAVFYKYKDQIDNNSVTVFILPEKITGLQVWNDVEPYHKIYDASVELQQPQYTFLAGKEYNLRISKGVQKKNTNSRSIAMSVRCVSE